MFENELREIIFTLHTHFEENVSMKELFAQRKRSEKYFKFSYSKFPEVLNLYVISKLARIIQIHACINYKIF